MPFNRYPYELPPLPYDYDTLEPYIDEETMFYHHDKHFRKYIDNLNSALKNNPRLQQLTLTQLLHMQKTLPPDIKRNAGGVYNHMLFFERLAPERYDSHMPGDELMRLINKTYRSFNGFKELFSHQASQVFGSGYTFLTVTPQKTLKIVSKPNQDTPIENNETPLILIDVWEHAYYLKYKNARMDYIENFWNVVKFPE